MINIEFFKLPIEYIENKVSLEPTIVDDLELLNTKDASAIPIYDIVFSPEHVFSKETIKLWAKYYTSDKKFLDDSKMLIKNFNSQNFNEADQNSNKNYDVTEKFNKINQIYKEVINDNGFYEKYQYIDFSWFKWLNNDGKFLQILSLYNLTSPVISLILPIIFLIIPFFILKLTKIPIDMNTYLDILKQLFSRHPLGQAFMHFKDAPVDKKFYITMSLAFYFFQIYQNFMICIRFYKNLYKIHNYLFELKEYINYTLDTFDIFDSQCKNLTSYQLFIDNMRENKTILTKFKQELEKITPWKLNLYKVSNIGQVMKCFYNLYDNKQLKNTLNYSFGFHGYVDNIGNLKKKLDKRQIALCKFSKNRNANENSNSNSNADANANKKLSKEKTKFKNAYFPSVIENPVKNTYSLDKQLLITGPNAAGKTTLLKTTFFNILFSQQAGVGFYSKATITPFSYLHCYLNIPDTSGRDSLFQAEARRCKNILNIIENSKQHEKHFCIFDELYSGTNPYEAISAAVSFLRYLNKYNNVSYILTTHFIDLCKKLDDNEKNSNHHMNIIEKDNDFKYTYELKKGISNIKGGVKVLKDLDYPEEIINSTKKLIQEINI